MHYGFRDYVSVAEKQAKAEKVVAKLRKAGKPPKPVDAFKGRMATTFWGKSWCDTLESYADYVNRLGRGRSYARSGCVCHLDLEDGVVKALVSGSRLYTVSVRIQALDQRRWRDVCAECAGQVGSLLELLQGKLSGRVMEIMCAPATGIFPSPAEMNFACSCPDWADMCKHVAAALYGIGRRLDTEPDLLFALRGVNAADLIPASLDFTQNARNSLQNNDLGALFGIDLTMDAHTAQPCDAATPTTVEPTPEAPRRKSVAKAAPVKAAKAAPTKPTPAKAAKPAPAKAAPVKDAPAKATKAPFKAERPTGYAIRRLRKLAGLSPAAFAQALGISGPTLYRWEESKGVLSLRSTSVEALTAFQKRLFAFP